jgi:hypothetical protein
VSNLLLSLTRGYVPLICPTLKEFLCCLHLTDVCVLRPPRPPLFPPSYYCQAHLAKVWPTLINTWHHPLYRLILPAVRYHTYHSSCSAQCPSLSSHRAHHSAHCFILHHSSHLAYVNQHQSMPITVLPLHPSSPESHCHPPTPTVVVPSSSTWACATHRCCAPSCVLFSSVPAPLD